MLLRICHLSKCCCWATCYVNFELLGWVDVYAGCSCGGSVGVVGVPVFHPLSLCLEVYLLSTVVWYSPLTSTNFCRLLARTFMIYSLLFRGFLEILWGSCWSSQNPSLLLFMILFYSETISYETYIFFWSDCNTLEACTRDNQVLGYNVSW